MPSLVYDMDHVMTCEEIKKHIEEIDKLNHTQMARLYRFAPGPHVYFDKESPVSEHFLEKFKRMGGMTSKISKQIGGEK